MLRPTRSIVLPAWTRLGRRLGWIAYVIVLLLAMHWPGVQIEGPVPRTDLWMHLGAFGAWTVGLSLTAWPGRIGTNANLVRTGLIAGVYAIVGELTQGLPGLHRVVAWEDAAANAAGVALGLSALAVLAAWLRRRDWELVESEPSVQIAGAIDG
ncbi:MAG: hypothetical protein AAF138_05600 [Planctomycetota bacterium]